MSIPSVSIIIPVYNGANYLREALDSALAQTYQNIEIIVVNDGSDDDNATQKIALSYGNKIKYYEKENGGVASALNLGITKMSGKYFSWLSHDDLYLPNKIERQIAFLNEFDGDVIAYSDYYTIDSGGNEMCVSNLNNIKAKRMGFYLMYADGLHGCSLLIPKVCFDVVGIFDESLLMTQDYALWFDMARVYEFAYMPEKLIKSRVHREQGSHMYNSRHKELIDDYYADCLNKLTPSDLVLLSGNDNISDVILFLYRNYHSRGLAKAAGNIVEWISKYGIDDVKL